MDALDHLSHPDVLSWKLIRSVLTCLVFTVVPHGCNSYDTHRVDIGTASRKMCMDHFMDPFYIQGPFQYIEKMTLHHIREENHCLTILKHPSNGLIGQLVVTCGTGVKWSRFRECKLRVSPVWAANFSSKLWMPSDSNTRVKVYTKVRKSKAK